MLTAALAHTGLTDRQPVGRCATPRTTSGGCSSPTPSSTACPRTSPRSSPATSDINVTLGYKAVYPEEAIQAHLAFLARRRALRPSEEYRVPTDEEWAGVPRPLRAPQGLHRHLRPRVRHPLHPRTRLHPLPDALARPRPTAPLVEIRDNLTARIAEAEREGWLGEVEGLQVSLAGAEDKLAQIDRRSHAPPAVTLGIPAVPAPRQPADGHRAITANDQVQRMRRVAITCGPVPVRAWERSSPKVTSRTQCSWFPVFQWPRIQSASWAGRAWAAGSDVTA